MSTAPLSQSFTIANLCIYPGDSGFKFSVMEISMLILPGFLSTSLILIVRLSRNRPLRHDPAVPVFTHEEEDRLASRPSGCTRGLWREISVHASSGLEDSRCGGLDVPLKDHSTWALQDDLLWTDACC